MDYYTRALALENELIENRRFFHKTAEVGLHMPKATAYIMEKLTEYGLSPELCGEGVIATVGQSKNVILLRADMDALPMPEESGLEFACPAGNRGHCCGHDLHAAMLLTAAKMLKENETQLNGTVKLMFQPAEETFEGAANMIAHGALEKPKPDVALAFHVNSGKVLPGTFIYDTSGEAVLFSMDGFQITVHGRGAHGAFPHMAVDPINIGVHIHLALQELIAREAAPTHACVLTVGQFTAGSAPNIIPESATLRGTIRTDNADVRALLVRRVREVSEKIAEAYGGTATVEMTSGIPALLCDTTLSAEMANYIRELPIPNLASHSGASTTASEDFSLISDQIPSTYIYLSAGFQDERGDAPAHNPKVQFNEDVLPIGAACMAQCASQWLKNHK